MLRKTSYTILFLLCCHCLQAQQVLDSIHPFFRGKLKAEKIRDDFDYFEVMRPSYNKGKQLYNDVILALFHSKALYFKTALNQKEVLGELDSFRFNSVDRTVFESGSPYVKSTAVPLFDSSEIIVTAYGINPGNRDLYQFRVLQDKETVIVPWRKISLFSPVMVHFRRNVDGSEQKEMAYLGSFRAPIGSSLTIECRNIMAPDTTYTISAVWIQRAPAVIATFTVKTMRDFFEVYKYQWKHDFFKPDGATYYGNIVMPPVDSLLQQQKTFDHADNNIFFYLKDKVKSEKLVEYNIVRGKDSSGWTPNSFDPNIIWLKNLQPGDYQLLLRYSFQKQNAGTYAFRVRPAWYQTIWFRIGAGIIVMIILSLLYVLYISRQQKTRLKKETLHKQRVQTELKSIRSQFNPHFVFNSLNSIQNLINSRKVEEANKYLSDFSSLMRDSLKTGSREMVSLTEELRMLKSYLELERLRFGFEYAFRVDEAINPIETEIPTLLLQPLVENAVKHGISGLYEKGILMLLFEKDGNDLRVSVEDNGKGFNTDQPSDGYGLKLTAERIALLNETMKGQHIAMNKHSAAGDTQIKLLFKNWFL